MPESTRKYQILGLYLLGLLSQNKIGKFHTELELIPPEKLEDIYILHVTKLEQYMMEGSYNKMFKSKSQVPADTYNVFMEKLLHTVREQIATCIEQAYETLTFEEAEKVLMTDSSTVKLLAEKHNWNSKEGKFFFRNEQPHPSKKQIPSTEYLLHSLNYAKELERII